jgi:NADH dehydrogenase
MARVLIFGGGFSGVFTAQNLAKVAPPGTEVVLVSETNYFTFQPLLPEVAAGALSASDSVTQLRQLLRNVTVVQAEILNVDFKAKTVTVTQGSKRRITEMSYDHLVLAMGQVVRLDRVPGLCEHAFPVKSTAHAHRLRNHVINCLEYADGVEDPEVRRRLLTFVVIGAGFSGVETIGEVKDMIDRSLKFYPNIAKHEVRMLLVEFAGRILNELPESLADYAAKRLEKQGIEVWLNTGVKAATFYDVEMNDGRKIETATIVATIGNGPSPLVEAMPVEKERGKIKTDPFMRVPSQENVWAVGDAALIPMKNKKGEDAFAPPTAQFAVREGKQLAANIAATLKGQPPKPFHYIPQGAMASIGNYRAVADVMGIRLSGPLAWLMWRTFYLGMLPGMVTKLRVVIDWALDLFAPRNLGQIEQAKKSAARLLRYGKGQTVFEPGMTANGFYTIVEGSFSISIARGEGLEPFERVLKKGDHFGERVLFRPDKRMHTGRVQALEDSVVLRLEKDDFWRLAHTMPMLEDYFRDYIKDKFPEDLRPEDMDRVGR